MKTRSYKDLFQLMIDNHELFKTGLCPLAHRMYKHDIINGGEKYKLKDYIHAHRPKKGKHYDPSQKDSIFYWNYGEWLPRLAWLKDQIKKSIFIWLLDQVKKYS